MPADKKRRPPTPEICPVCGEDVPRNALACPDCGADHRSGWREDALAYDGTGIAEDGGFDYDAYVAREFGGPSPKPSGVKPLWWITAVVLLAAFVWVVLRQIFFF